MSEIHFEKSIEKILKFEIDFEVSEKIVRVLAALAGDREELHPSRLSTFRHRFHHGGCSNKCPMCLTVKSVLDRQLRWVYLVRSTNKQNLPRSPT